MTRSDLFQILGITTLLLVIGGATLGSIQVLMDFLGFRGGVTPIVGSLVSVIFVSVALIRSSRQDMILALGTRVTPPGGRILALRPSLTYAAQAGVLGGTLFFVGCAAAISAVGVTRGLGLPEGEQRAIAVVVVVITVSIGWLLAARRRIFDRRIAETIACQLAVHAPGVELADLTQHVYDGAWREVSADLARALRSAALLRSIRAMPAGSLGSETGQKTSGLR